jgi:hypothetical protein
VLIEERGTPATVLITEPFQGIVATSAAKLGAPGYHALVVPHPIWGRDEETLQGLARQIADTALQQLTAAPVAA